MKRSRRRGEGGGGTLGLIFPKTIIPIFFKLRTQLTKSILLYFKFFLNFSGLRNRIRKYHVVNLKFPVPILFGIFPEFH